MAHDEHADEHAGRAHGKHGGHGHGGGHEEGHEGAPEWLISFADNVMLMMGVFVILLVLNMAKTTTGGIGGEAQMGGTPDAAMLDFAIAVRSAFNNPVSITSTDPAEAQLVRRLLERNAPGDADRPGPRGENPRLQSADKRELERIGATIPFAEGSATLTGSARAIIADTADKLRGERWIIEVRGHASPYETFRDVQKGFDLGYQRGKAVANALAEAGIDIEQIRIVSCSDNERVIGRPGSAQADRPNQRTEIILTNEPRAGDAYTEPGVR